MALAAHAADLPALEAFTDYTEYFRDIRIGLALGLGFRGKTDGYPLLEKLAHDPIFTVHRECRQRHQFRFTAPRLSPATLSPGSNCRARPLRPEYPAPGPYQFANRTPEPASLPGTVALDPNDPNVVVKALQAAIDPAQYKSVGNTFARNAERMRIFDAWELAKVLDVPAAAKQPLTPELEKALQAALDSPFPFAHYLAARLDCPTRRNEIRPAACPEAARLHHGRRHRRLLLVRRHARAPQGPRGDPDPRAVRRIEDLRADLRTRRHGVRLRRRPRLGMIADGPEEAEIASLLASENVWLRAGVLDGLVDAHRPVAGPRAAQDPGTPAQRHPRRRSPLRPQTDDAKVGPASTLVKRRRLWHSV